MPSIANQDFKIYGLLKEEAYPKPIGIYAQVCGEVYAAVARVEKSALKQAQLADGFVFGSGGDCITRLLTGAGHYIDPENGQMEMIDTGNHVENPAYYDALWAIQQAIYYGDNGVPDGNIEFMLDDAGTFMESGFTGVEFVNEDGYFIKGTAEGGILTSLYLGEKAEHPENCIVVRLESLLPLVGDLPLETTEIW